MPIKIKSSGGGSVSLDVPNIGTDYTLTMPANNATIITSAGGTITGNVAFTSNNITIAGQTLSPSGGMRNRLINGDMKIWQRATSNTGLTTGGTFTADRFYFNCGTPGTGVFTVERSSDVPSGQGFPYSWKLYPTTAMSSVGANTFASIVQNVESLNVSDLSYGTSSAKTITLSFWVKSNITGVVPGTIGQTQGGDRAFPFIYTIDAVDTWQKIVIVIPGDTNPSASLPFNTGIGLHMNFGYMSIGSYFQNGTVNSWNSNVSSNNWIASGQTYINRASSTSNYMSFTGLQLETGSASTPFEFRHYGTEFALCQRYYQKFRASNEGYVTGSTNVSDGCAFSVYMRASPTVTYIIRQQGNTNSNPNAYMIEPWGTSTYIGISGSGNYNWHIDGIANAEV